MRIGAQLCLVLLLLTAGLHAATNTLQGALDALASKDAESYDQAVKFLTKHSEQADPLLIKMFRDSSQAPLARLRAVKLLGDFGDKAAISDMQQALDSHGENNAAVRVEIVRSLSKLGGNSTLIEHLNKRQNDEPIVSAAIAVGLQGHTDEDSKKAMGMLLQNDDTRVSRAALMAVSKTYEPIANEQQPSTSNGSVKSERPQLAEAASGEKLNPTPGDQAIFRALEAKKASKDLQISQKAAALLDELSQHFKQK
jgi:hypothetical protein